MRDYIQERVLCIAAYILDKKATVRDAAKVFGVSKSTVHKDMCERLLRINRSLYRRVRLVLDENKAERHIRGGLATHRKYRGMDKTVEKKPYCGYDPK
jgi:putative DeoR family transcriptional regulator (stage III sporulation protein D)